MCFNASDYVIYFSISNFMNYLLSNVLFLKNPPVNIWACMQQVKGSLGHSNLTALFLCIS